MNFYYEPIDRDNKCSECFPEKGRIARLMENNINKLNELSNSDILNKKDKDDE